MIAESFTPRVMRGWGLGYSDVREMLPDVVYFSTCQQGQTGPHSEIRWIRAACRVARRVLLRDRLAGQGSGRSLWRIL